MGALGFGFPAEQSKWSDAFVSFKHEERREEPRLAAGMIRMLESSRNP